MQLCKQGYLGLGKSENTFDTKTIEDYCPFCNNYGVLQKKQTHPLCCIMWFMGNCKANGISSKIPEYSSCRIEEKAGRRLCPECLIKELKSIG